MTYTEWHGITKRDETAVGNNFVAQLDLDESYSKEDSQGNPLAEVQVVGSVDIFGGSGSPAMPAHAHAHVEVDSFNEKNPWQTTGYVMGSLRYEFRVLPNLTPPAPMPGGAVPLSVHVVGEVSPEISSNASGICYIIMENAIGRGSLRAETETAPGPGNVADFDQTFTFMADAGGSPASCEIFASAFARVAGGTAASMEAQATVDPTIVFDQAVFDEIMGENTFNLADYFTIEVSGGIDPRGSATVPEGTACLLLSSAFTGLAARRGRRMLPGLL